MSLNSSIRILPPELQSQIAAGEVLERPASAVKELVENSLDAGATSIDVKIERGGQEKILVQDNGQGIPEEELPLALTRHATSKIGSMDDLLNISSFGFRGEALASIASVSRTTISTIVSGAEQGAQAEVMHGRISEIRPAAIARGTRIDVRDLFANIPVRLKFLKTTATESKRCQEAMAHIALAHLDVSFSLTHNGREIFRFMGGEALEDRLQRIWPPSLMQGLSRIRYERDAMRVTGLIGAPRQAQGRGNRIIIYVNERPVKDKLLLRALRQGYQGTLLSREYPQAVLFVTLPTREVDINVHPAKTEVRFMDERAIFTLVQGAVRKGLETLQTQPDSLSTSLGSSVRENPISIPASTIGHDPSFIPACNSAEHAIHQHDEEGPKFSTVREAERLFSAQEPLSDTPKHSLPEDPSKAAWPRAVAGSPSFFDGSDDQTSPSNPVSEPHGLTYLGQFDRTYLILSQGDTLMLMDQHAAHERILYHVFSTAGNKGEHQRLAIPLEMTLHSSEIDVLERIWGDLAQIGFTLDRPEPATLLIRSIPTSLVTDEAINYLRSALGEQTRDMNNLWTTLSCKSAIKAGHVLAYEEAMALVQAWSECPDNRYCPHGRPVILTWTVRELEKLFKRKP